MIGRLVAKEKENIISWRRQIHKQPELGFQEHKTGELVANLLCEFGYEVERGVGGTGVVGILKGSGSGNSPAVALRADMDALLILEENQVPYASQNPGVMHACGHDGHTAILLGAAKVLAQCQDQLRAPVVVLFQPAEERLGGARAVLREGFFNKYNIGEIYGLHLWPQVPKGKVGMKVGAVMAGSIDFKLKLLGQPAHAAEPQNSVDAIVAGAAIVGALQAIPSRFINPGVCGGLCGYISCRGDCKYYPRRSRAHRHCQNSLPHVYQQLPQLLERVIENTAAVYGAKVDLQIKEGYPVTMSEPESVALLERVVTENLGEDGVYQLERCFMSSEDFSYYLEEVPGAYFFLGTGPERKLHQPTFDFDEDLLAVGAEVWQELPSLPPCGRIPRATVENR